jgi:saccharopine dehydrogenase-like NADP-dependent oxidoreductase
MQTILVAGAGKSSVYLIEYLLGKASRNKWKVIIADSNSAAVLPKVRKHPAAEAAVIDIANDSEREALVKRSDIVLSLLPPHLHIHLAKDCLKYKKHFITSSYMSDDIKALNDQAKAAGLMFMCEMGLDPGIDHMTASKIITSIKKVAGLVLSFKSYCGGLVAPESDDNPWHYKFTWNPRNVITAGMGGARYLLNGKQTEIPYEKMFENNKKIKIPGINALAYYPNRDSMKYVELYDIPEVRTMIRATLRYPAFCKGWNALITLGLTTQDDSFKTDGLSYADWVAEKTACRANAPLQKHVAEKLGVDEGDSLIKMLDWLGLFGSNYIGVGQMSSADILLGLLSTKWSMSAEDKDMIIMNHEIEYEHKGRNIVLNTAMVVTGEGGEYTAMAKAVGMPIAILAELVLTKKIVPPTGVVLPIMQSVYRPVLRELDSHGLSFVDYVA